MHRRRSEGPAARGQRGREGRQDDRRQGPAGRGPVRRARAREDGQDLRRPRRVRERAAPELPGSGHGSEHCRGRRAFDGPLHNQIPEPDRTKDNKTIWQANYNRGALPGAVLRDGRRRRLAQEVVRAPVVGPLQRRRHGHRLGEGPLQRGALRPQQRLPVRQLGLQQHAASLIRDAINAWVDRPEGGAARPTRRSPTDAQVLRPVGPQRLRPRRQLQRAGRLHRPLPDRPRRRRPGRRRPVPGRGRDLVAPLEGVPELDGPTGPAFNKDGGMQIGTTGLWVADYTMQPENGGVSVFAHEYAHDLGLPDEYDTAAATGTQENAVNWWSIMAQSRQSGAGEPGVGTRAADFGAWDKLQLGWLDYEVVPAGQDAHARPRPVTSTTAPRRRASSCRCPRRPSPPSSARRTAGPSSGGPDQGDEREATLTRQVTLPGGQRVAELLGALEHRGLRPRRRATTRTSRSTTGAASRPSPARSPTPPRATASTASSRTGRRRRSTCRRSPARRSRCGCATQTDPAQQGARTSHDGAGGHLRRRLHAHGGRRRRCSPTAPRAGNNGWTPDGFEIVGASKSISYDNYYVASNRQYVSYDQYLQTGPYNFCDPDAAELGGALPVPERADRLATGTRRTRTTTRACTRARARSCRSTRTRGRSSAWTGCRGGRASRRTTRRSRSRRPTRSRSTCRTGSRATSAARTPCRCSTTGGPTGTRRCRTSA